MLPWNAVYKRLRDSDDFRLYWGRSFRQDEFRYYAYCMKFESVPGALLSLASNPNLGDQATTFANLRAPTTPIAPGRLLGPLNINFPAGAVILGVSSCANDAQTTSSDTGGAFSFAYSPSEGMNYHGGDSRDLYMLRIQYSDNDNVTAGNPIDPTTIAPTFPIKSVPIGIVEGMLGCGFESEFPHNELLVSPSQALLVSVQSMEVSSVVAATGTPQSSQRVHVVFHCMVPGTVEIDKKKDAA